MAPPSLMSQDTPTWRCRGSWSLVSPEPAQSRDPHCPHSQGIGLPPQACSPAPGVVGAHLPPAPRASVCSTGIPVVTTHMPCPARLWSASRCGGHPVQSRQLLDLCELGVSCRQAVSPPDLGPDHNRRPPLPRRKLTGPRAGCSPQGEEDQDTLPARAGHGLPSPGMEPGEDERSRSAVSQNQRPKGWLLPTSLEEKWRKNHQLFALVK